MATRVINLTSTPTAYLDKRRGPSISNLVVPFAGHEGGGDATLLPAQHVPPPSSISSSTRPNNGNMSHLRNTSGSSLAHAATPLRLPPPPPPPGPISSRATLSHDNRPFSPKSPVLPPPPPPPIPPRRHPFTSSPPSEVHSCPSTYPDPERRTASPDFSVSSRPTSEPWGEEREQLLLKYLHQPVFTPPRPHSTSSGSLTESEDMFGTNKLQFPPLLPTVGSRAALFRNRKYLTHAITSTVGQTERRTNRLAHTNLIPSSTSRRDTSTVSDASESSFSSEDGIIQGYWGKIKENRISIGVTKEMMARERNKMRELRRKKDKADTTFMNFARLMLASRESPSKLALDHRFEEMQRLHTEYQYVESQYELLELELDKSEGELNVLEVEFFSTIARRYLRERTTAVAPNARDPVEHPEYERDVPFELLGISWNGPTGSDDDHPFWKALVDAIGDMGLAVEDLEELRVRREQIKYDTELQKNISKRAREENEEFVNEFPREEAEKEARLEEARALVRRLREKCHQHGVTKKHPSYAVAYALDPEIDEDLALDDMAPTRQTLAHHRFSTLLSCPDHLLRQPEPLSALGELKQVAQLPSKHPGRKLQLEVAMKEYGIHQLVFDTTSKVEESDYVQRWLLHQVRTCPLEAYQLASVFQETTSLTIKDNERWQHDVLHHWWRDGTSEPPGHHETATHHVRDFVGDLQSESVPSLSLGYASGPIPRSTASLELLPTLPAWETQDSSKTSMGQVHTGRSRATKSTGGR